MKLPQKRWSQKGYKSPQTAGFQKYTFILRYTKIRRRYPCPGYFFYQETIILVESKNSAPVSTRQVAAGIIETFVKERGEADFLISKWPGIKRVSPMVGDTLFCQYNRKLSYMYLYDRIRILTAYWRYCSNHLTRNLYDLQR